MSQNQIKLFRSDDILCMKGEDGDLGQGGYGTVRIGFHDILGVVAVKCSAMMGGRRERILLEKKIRNEIGNLQNSQHENIVRVYGWTQWHGSLAIIMEYLPAGNLKTMLLDEDVSVPPLLRLRICAEISTGIAFIHNLFDDKRLLHGDIKPENVLMTEDLHCKIADFGSAHLSSYTGSTAISIGNQSKSFEYTLLYAAPERLRNIANTVTPKYDTYSVGMTFHMVLTRQTPFGPQPSMDNIIFISKILDGQRPSLQSICSCIEKLDGEGSHDDVAILQLLKEETQRCWQQNPDDRPCMIDVRDRLCIKLANRDLAIVRQQVTDALHEMDVTKPFLESEKCVSIDKFLPPNFNTTSTLLEKRHAKIRKTLEELSVIERDVDYSSEERGVGRIKEKNSRENVDFVKRSVECSDEGINIPSTVSRQLDSNDSFTQLEVAQSPNDPLRQNETPTTSSASLDIYVYIEKAKRDIKKAIENLSKHFTGLKMSLILNPNVKKELKMLQDYLQINNTENFRKEVADEIARSRAVPTFITWWSVFADNERTGFSISESKSCFRILLSVLVSATRVSSEFCVQCGECILLPIMVAGLRKRQNESEDTKGDYVLQMIRLLYNCAKFSRSLKFVKQLDMFDRILWYSLNAACVVENNTMEFAILATFLSAYLAEEEQLKLISTEKDMIYGLMDSISQMLISENNESVSYSWSIDEGVCGLAKLAQNAENNKIILDKPDVDAWISCLLLRNGKEEEKQTTLMLIQILCTFPETKKKIKEDQSGIFNVLKIVRVEEANGDLRKLVNERIEAIEAEEEGILRRFFSSKKS